HHGDGRAPPGAAAVGDGASDRVGTLAPRIVRRDERDVRAGADLEPHRAPLRRVAPPAGSEHDEDTAVARRRELPRRLAGPRARAGTPAATAESKAARAFSAKTRPTRRVLMTAPSSSASGEGASAMRVPEAATRTATAARPGAQSEGPREGTWNQLRTTSRGVT